jgi:hypothetical protein
MLTAVQQHAIDRFAKSLATLGDDSLIDAYHQAWEDHRDARAEGSDNLDKVGAESLATETRCAGAFRIIKAATRRGTHEPAGPGCLGDATGAGCCAGERAGMRFLEFFAANNRVSLPLSPKPRAT